MRALAIVGVALSCAYGCSGDDSSSPPSNGDAGQAGDLGSGSGGDAGGGAVAMGGASLHGGQGGDETGSNQGGAAGEAGAQTTEAGAAGAGGSDSPAILVGIDGDATRFLDYGKLQLGFEQAVDAATLTITLSPQLPAKLVVTSTSQVDATTVEATLAYYHLPRDYQLSVSGNLPNGTPFEASAVLSGLGNGARAAFLSQQGGPGALSSWTGVPDGSTPLEAADSVCQREADAAGLRGTFQAFLSINGSVDAGCRALGLSGTIANNCGEASMPLDNAPFLSLDGRPIVAGATDIMADRWAIPIPFHADGSAAAPFFTWTGSRAGAKGSANLDCAGWTDGTAATIGLPSRQVGERLLSYELTFSCDRVAQLLCLQTTGTFFGPSTLHHDGAKRAFVSKGTLFGNMAFDGKSGVAAADALCQSEAAAESLANPARFRAYLGTAETDALCYVLGQSGKVEDQCGLPALPDSDPWQRVDDYPVGTAAQLAAGTLTAPLALAADATLMSDARPRTGTELDGATSWNCADWLGTGFYSLSGHPAFITGHFTSHWTTDCDGEETSVYCFEN